MKLSSTVVLYGSAVALAAPSAERRQALTDVVENGSFETGTTGWTFTGGARIASNSEGRDTNPWSFTATDGSNFAILTSTNSNLTSSVATDVGGLSHITAQGLSFDWHYLAIASGRGPPSLTCTLQTSLFDGFTVQSWTRQARAGGSGRVDETFTTGTSGGTVTIELSCVGDTTATFNVGVAIDNVKWTGTVV